MAVALVASSGHKIGANQTWTHTFTVGNAVTAQEWNDSSNAPGTTDFKDSSGTPKNLSRDITSGLGGSSAAANYSLIVPSGFTSPLKGPTVYEEWIAAEWSGLATSAPLLDTSASGTTGGTGTLNGATINTGSNAGLVLATASINVNNSSNESITVTGTSFGDTYSTSHDGTQQNNSADDAGSAAFRTTSPASIVGLRNVWTFSGTTLDSANVISSYNLAAATPAAPVGVVVSDMLFPSTVAPLGFQDWNWWQPQQYAAPPVQPAPVGSQLIDVSPVRLSIPDSWIVPGIVPQIVVVSSPVGIQVMDSPTVVRFAQEPWQFWRPQYYQPQGRPAGQTVLDLPLGPRRYIQNWILQQAIGLQPLGRPVGRQVLDEPRGPHPYLESWIVFHLQQYAPHGTPIGAMVMDWKRQFPPSQQDWALYNLALLTYVAPVQTLHTLTLLYAGPA